MQLNKIILYSSFIFLLAGNTCQSAMLDYLSPVDPTQVKPLKDSREESMYALPAQKAVLTQNSVHNQYEIAMQRFMQANVKSAYMDFKMLISHIVPNDYAYLRIADNMAEIGLFNLSDAALKKVSDKTISSYRADDVKKFYFPKSILADKDEIYLAEVYSNIMYNAQSKEATAELIKNTDLLEKSDYANYIAALGFLKAGNITNAHNYIDNALKINPDNINYQKLKIEVLFQEENSKDALKVLENIKHYNFNTETYVSKIETLEKFTLYKAEKDDAMKKYYLASYYYSLGDDIKALRTLQGAISAKKKTNRLVYGLMSEVYYRQKEYEKAQNFADKSLQLGGNNADALMVMGKVNYRNQKYKDALKYFKALGTNTSAQVWMAMTYTASGDTKSAKEIYSKILKEHSNCAEAYYNIALSEPDRALEYLKKAVAINLNYADSWLELAKAAIARENTRLAGRYLDVVKYIDENDFRYYYYQGLVFKAKGLNQDANYYFKKSLAINPNNELAKKELGI